MYICLDWVFCPGPEPGHRILTLLIGVVKLRNALDNIGRISVLMHLHSANNPGEMCGINMVSSETSVQCCDPI